MPITPPLNSDDVDSRNAGVRDTIAAPPSHGTGSESKETSWLMAEDQMKTPTSDQAPSLPTSLSRNLSAALHNNLQPQVLGSDVNTGPSRMSEDYFASRLPDNSKVADFRHGGLAPASDPSSPNASPSLSGAPSARNSPIPVSPDNYPLTWKEFSAQHTADPAFYHSANARPTSVPNFQTKPVSQRREGPDYPNYPDQSFKALQYQQYPPPYRPRSPHPLRTRSSHLSQSSSFSSSDNQSTKDLPHFPSGAKTVGNTPAQSPGLFSPVFPAKKQWPSESDDGRSVTPMLHPTHHKPPKE